MICPQCHAEYRDGFSRCSDCDVGLVHALANDDGALASPSPPDPDEDPFCEFWKGADDRLHGELLEILEEVSIPCKSLRRNDRLFNSATYPTFRIGVPFSLFEKAELAVKAAFEPEHVHCEAIWVASPRLLPPSE